MRSSLADLRAEDSRLDAKGRDAQAKVDRARRADALLGDELLQAAFADLRESLTKAWGESEPAQVQLREDAWRASRLLDKIEEQIRRHVRDGTKAGHDLLMVNKRRAWIDRLLRRAA